MTSLDLDISSSAQILHHSVLGHTEFDSDGPDANRAHHGRVSQKTRFLIFEAACLPEDVIWYKDTT